MWKGKVGKLIEKKGFGKKLNGKGKRGKLMFERVVGGKKVKKRKNDRKIIEKKREKKEKKRKKKKKKVEQMEKEKKGNCSQKFEYVLDGEVEKQSQNQWQTKRCKFDEKLWLLYMTATSENRSLWSGAIFKLGATIDSRDRYIIRTYTYVYSQLWNFIRDFIIVLVRKKNKSNKLVAGDEENSVKVVMKYSFIAIEQAMKS
ncbi:hypothetical protein RFI_39926 [Reticulomyxa filosa]|uniref:Uncharacterized protein n=1 Tax=Reticulomyxa filosa TaxID=46433 RepID=X6L874_RETFI|nr:hypothetical protein RFI_39926 [Reticulomyxa filosa]|eukprot:ETN97603.1 hypothetical protein RFI_39926 [Reticulomyxa filosa]